MFKAKSLPSHSGLSLALCSRKTNFTSNYLSRSMANLAMAKDSVEPAMPRSYPTIVLEHSPSEALKRKQLPARTGVLAVKHGMSGIWDEKGRKVPVTILQLDRNQVTHIKTKSIHGYNAVQVGAGLRQASNVTKAMLGHFSRSQVAPKKKVAEFRVKDASALLPLGSELRADHFKIGQYVDVRCRSKGKGFAGVMKRHGFKGLRASHGVSISHRSAGSMGQSQDPGRVLPGKKMAGRMGGKQVTVQNVPIVGIDAEQGLIMVKGPVPGPKSAFVSIQDAIKR